MERVRQNSSFLHSLGNPDAMPRAVEQSKRLKSGIVDFVSKGGLIPRPVPHPTPLTNRERARAQLARMGYGGDEAAGDLPIPEFMPDTEPKTLPDPQKNPRTSIAQFSKFVGTGTLLGLAKAFEPSDVFSETAAESTRQIPRVVTGDFGAIEAPTVVTEGFGAAVESFEDRPFWTEQIPLSVIDPLIVFAGGKITLKIITKSLIKAGIMKLPAKEAAKQAAQAAAREEFRKSFVHSPVVPENPSLLARHAGQSLGVLERIPGLRTAAGKLRRAADPYSEIDRLPVGSPNRIALETSLIFNNADEVGQAFVEVMMSEFRTKHNIHKLFGTKNGFDDIAPRATKVTVKPTVSQPGIDTIFNDFIAVSIPAPSDFVRFAKRVRELPLDTPAMQAEVRKKLKSIRGLLNSFYRQFIEDDARIEDIAKNLFLDFDDPKALRQTLKGVEDAAELRELRAQARGQGDLDQDLDRLQDLINSEVGDLRRVFDAPANPNQRAIELFVATSKGIDKLLANPNTLDRIIATQKTVIASDVLRAIHIDTMALAIKIPAKREAAERLLLELRRNVEEMNRAIDALPPGAQRVSIRTELENVRRTHQQITELFQPAPASRGVRGEAPYFGNVVENRHLYNLTISQEKAIEDIHSMLDEFFKYMRLEGVDVEEFGKGIDGFFFFPRRSRDQVSGKMRPELTQIPGRQRIGLHRTQDTMKETMYAKGKRYEGPYEVLNSYFRAGYTEVARKRAEGHAGVFFKSQKIDPAVLQRKHLAENVGFAQERSIRDIEHMVRGFIPTAATVAAIKRSFPGLAKIVTDVLSFQPSELADVVRQVSREALSAAKLSETQFRNIIAGLRRPTIDPATLGREQRGVDLTPIDKLARRLEDTPLTPEEFAQFNPDDITDFLHPALDRPDRDLLKASFREGTRPEITGGAREAISVDEVVKALTKAGVEAETAAKLVTETAEQALKTASELRKQTLRALSGRMRELRKANIDELAAANDEVKFAQSRARSLGPTEGSSGFFPNQIYKDFTYIAADGKTQLRRGDEIAADLERRLIDKDHPIWKPFSKITAILRSMKTVVDFGAPFIQGFPTLMRDPALWGKATAAHYQAFLDPRVRSRYIAHNSTDIVEMIKHGGQLGSTEFTEAMMSGGWLARLPMIIDDAPVPLGPARAAGRGAAGLVYATANRFGNSFETFLDLARIETWKALRGSAKTTRDLDDLAGFVNKVTGTTSARALGVPLTQRQFEAALPFFSPRYFRATVGLYMDIFRGGLRGNQARIALGRLMFGAGAVHVAGARALGQDIHLDPTKPAEFMRWEIFGQRIGPVGKPMSMMKSGVAITAQAADNPDGFLQWNMFSAEDYRENAALRAARNQASLLGSNIISFVTDADALGRSMPGMSEPVDLAKHAGKEVVPFWLNAAMEAGNFKGALAAGGAEGVGGGAFPIPPYAIRDELWEKYSQSDFGMSFEDVQKQEFGGRAHKRQLLAAHPDLKAAYDISIEEQRGRKLSADRITVKDNMDDISEKWVESGKRTGNNFFVDVGNAAPDAHVKMRRGFREAGIVKREGREWQEKNYPKVFEDAELYYEETNAALAEEVGGFTLIAQQEFFDRLVSDETLDPVTGRTNYAAVDRLRADIDAEFGPGMMAKIDKFQQDKQLAENLHPMHAEFIKSFETLRPYWEAYKEALPEEDWAVWRSYDVLPEADKATFRYSGRNFLNMERLVERERADMKRNSPEIDSSLFLIYGMTPTNREHINRLRKGLTNP